MKSKLVTLLLVATFFTISYGQDQKKTESTKETKSQVTQSPYKFEKGFPVAGTSEKVYNAIDLRRAIEAYKFFYGTVATEAVIQQGISVGAKINEAGIVMATGPRQQFGAANSDTPYEIATLDLKVSGPMVVELPAGPLTGFVDDHNMRWVQDLGTIGPDKGLGGKHLILPPDYLGEIPAGYFAGKSKTWKVIVFIRVVPMGGDIDKAIQAVSTVKIYPLATAKNPTTFNFINVSDKKMTLPILTWEGNIEYWNQLHKVIQNETTLDEFRPMLGMLASLGIEKGKPFNPDLRMKNILEEAAQTAIGEMRVVLYDSRNPARFAWKDRKWEWFPHQLINSKTGDFGLPEYLDLESSDGYYWVGYGVSAAIGKPAVGAGSVYWMGFRDSLGAYLDGSKSYKLTIPGVVPAKLFWSITVYDVDTRCLIATDQDKAAVRSHLDNPEANSDGSYDIYFGPNAPVGKEGMWVKTIPGKGWFCALRIYGPQAPAFDGSWKLSDIVEVKSEK
jgi:hypothetical protein